jgi:hypothetical protein
MLQVISTSSRVMLQLVAVNTTGAPPALPTGSLSSLGVYVTLSSERADKDAGPNCWPVSTTTLPPPVLASPLALLVLPKLPGDAVCHVIKLRTTGGA